MARVERLISHRKRLKILKAMLEEGEFIINQLASKCSVSHTAVKSVVSLMEKMGMLVPCRAGTVVIYRVVHNEKTKALKDMFGASA